MEPTISASSKAIYPRKKILTERNEASGFTPSDTHRKKPPNLDPKSNPKQMGVVDRGQISSQVSPMLSSSDVLASDEEDDAFVPYSSLRPYDPLTNYLSPRPKFLRYKPNRRRDIFLRREGEGGGERQCGLSPTKSASFDSKKGLDGEESSNSASGSSDSCSREGLWRQEDGGSKKNAEEQDDEVEEEEEEVEEKSDWNMKWILKTLFVIVVLVLSTAYISSMNSSSPPQGLQTIRRLRREFLRIEDMIYRAISLSNFEGENDFSDGGEMPEIAPVPVGEEVVICEAEGIEWIEEAEVVKRGAASDCKNVEAGKGIIDELITSNIELQETEISEKIGSSEDYQMLRIFELVGNQVAMAKSMNVSDNVVETDSGSREDGQAEDVVLIDDQSFSRSVEEVKIAKDEKVRVDDISEKVEIIDHGLDEGVEDAKIAENEQEEVDVNIRKAVEIGSIVLQKIDQSIKQMLSWLAPYNVVWVAVILTGFVASLMAKFYFKCKKASSKANSSNVKLSSESGIAECSIFPRTKEVKKIVQIAEVNAPPISYPMEEEKVPKETPPRCSAPIVQLLGELVLGEVNSSLKRSAMRSKMSERIDESSNQSVPQRSKSRSASGVATHDQGSPTEFSSMASTSYESYTAQEKIDKEVGKDGEATKAAIPTPVRRSSRIRKRGVTSP
ncbi:hypothetical protein Ancab_012284 [Ancistrocladus abbreviatus]